MKIVISLGGSVLTKSLTYKNFKKFADLIKKISKKHQIFVVVGGGKTCRIYQKIAKSGKATNKDLDEIGIIATHLNAKTFSSIIKNCYYIGLKSEKEAMKELKSNLKKYKIFVLAGYDIGHSTDYDAVIVAKNVNADLILNISNVNGIYDKDPKKYKGAKKLEKISYKDLIKICRKNLQKPGEYRLFDLKAAILLSKMKIPSIFVDDNVKNIINAINGKEVGTIVLDYVWNLSSLLPLS